MLRCGGGYNEWMIAALFEIIGGSSEGFVSAVTEVRPSFSALYMFSTMELDLPCAFIGLMLRPDCQDNKSRTTRISRIRV